MRSEKTGVVLMTYGSATTADGVGNYLNQIYKGTAPAALIEDFENRYRLIGKSPLVEITRAQAAALEAKLGEEFVVRAGMRHSEPFIAEAAAACRAEGAARLVGLILSPQFSSFIMEGYRTAFMDAARAAGFDDANVRIVGPWPDEPHFIECLANRAQAALAALSKAYGRSVPVIFTTHSLPKKVVDKDPSYLAQLSQTIEAIRSRLDPDIEWYAAYQSAGHSPEPWLTPDLADVFASLALKKAPAALIVPIQFLADHLEILYDLDIAAKRQCETLGLAYHRTELPNMDPLFIEALASLALSTQEEQA